ncbi:MAG: hypothetical protein BGO69_15265 [Bacteroidetes bacterium 46-16]|nr:MAG: hypothetical protein BGO69_15265 [Bacteroidetes bacterium 46-16]
MSRRDYYRQDERMQRQRERMYRRRRPHNKGDKIIFGLIVALVGLVFMFRTLGMFPFSIAFTWPLILIVIGMVIAIKNRFHGHAWWILTLIGVANLTPVFTINGVPSTHLVWPAAIILFGLAIIFKGCKKKEHWMDGDMNTVTNTDSMLNVDVTFGGRKEIVTSKDFKGGTVSTTFGGCEVNLMQADSTEPNIILELKVSFGGVELIVPSNWDIQNEINPAFGSVEDHRSFRTASTEQEKKTLVLKGNCSFGSIEIKSY